MAHPGKKTKAARNAALLFGKAVREAQIAVKLSRYKHSLEYAIPREAYFHSPRPPQGQQMDLRCPNLLHFGSEEGFAGLPRRVIPRKNKESLACLVVW